MTQLTLYAPLKRLQRTAPRSGVQLSPLTKSDIPALSSVYLLSYDSAEVAADITEATQEMVLSFAGEYGEVLPNFFVGAWVESELIGAVLMVVDPPWDDLPNRGPFIIDLMVLPQFRHQGIATALIGEVAYRALQSGYETVGLRVDTLAAADAARLYQRLGFTQVRQ